MAGRPSPRLLAHLLRPLSRAHQSGSRRLDRSRVPAQGRLARYRFRPSSSSAQLGERYTSRYSSASRPATPPPSRPPSGSSATFRPVPPQYAFIDPSIPPAPLDSTRHPEGSQLLRSNLFVARGKPRLATAYWEQGAAYRMHQALEAHVGEVRERYYRMRGAGSGAFEDWRATVSREVRGLCELALAILRLMRSTIEGFEVNSSIATRLVRLSWANAQEWRAICDDQVKIAVSPLVYAQHNTSVVMEYAKLGLERVQAWTLEVDSPLSLHLRKAAHERGDRAAWQQLQWREIAYRQGVDGCKAVRVQLAKMVARFLDSVRSRSGISSYDYVAYFERLQELQPDDLRLQPRKELLPRS
ncbi:hypothetical protein Rhopal_001523-T1 [Rhodotorula paludigena]|uniref:Uncharacterized protein n=1 Tax=Rhodotorula paludigena TaxID=86838 RepID=A0AAV5GGT4_9BASI|nr:hypothetical protein Rhopal_001523-T1 [Rhodotorula paludigena]